MDTNQNKGAGFQIIENNWGPQSKNLKDKYAQLTDADLKFEVGKEHELVTRLQTKLNKSREEVINIINKSQPEKV